jgi:hypothetical protein
VTAIRSIGRRDVVRILDSNASLLVLLLANFFLLELVDDQRWGALGSTLLAALALVVAISDPESGHRLSRRHWIQVGACVALAPLVLIVNSTSVVGLTYLLPVGLLSLHGQLIQRVAEHRDLIARVQRHTGTQIARANSIFEATRRRVGPHYWDEDTFSTQVRCSGFSVLTVRRTFLGDASLLVWARKNA